MSSIKPIYVDEPVNSNLTYFKQKNTLVVSEIFSTIQGEGPFAGRRCVFLRLAGCNFGGKGETGPGCEFCDTNFAIDDGEVMSFEKILKKIKRVYPGNPTTTFEKRLIVITGGEPFLQNNVSDFIKYTKTTVDWNDPKQFTFQIETNGTRIPPSLSLTGVYVVVSPKILRKPDGGLIYYGKLPDRVLERADCLKFVVSSDASTGYNHVPEYAKGFRKKGKPVYVSPMAVYKKEPPTGKPRSVWDRGIYDYEKCKANYNFAAKLAMEEGWIVSIQQHLFLAVA